MQSLYSLSDNQFMTLAIRQAKSAIYTTRPNPNVGCVIVKNDQVLAVGYHRRAGDSHAEVNALATLNLSQTQGATAYVTLEPCSHTGRTGACALALIEAKIGRVVCAMQDPNPLVSGKGVRLLEEAGIEVSVGLMQAQAEQINLGFIKRMSEQLPRVTVKLAMSLDGRTAMQSGESQWITGSAARADVQRLRASSCAIITGIGSIEQDDSSLTVRPAELDVTLSEEDLALIGQMQPLRVVLDSNNRLSKNAKILQQPGRTLRVVSGPITEGDIDVISLPGVDSRIDLTALLEYLAREENCNNVLVEAGATLAGSFIDRQLFDQLIVYMAPTILGASARPLLAIDKDKMQQQQRLKLVDHTVIGDDIRLTYESASTISATADK
ncbi:MAG: bifunctional diaminohydroxyphosphoribosylaminopyrimidine deaminase/5-amino-6-(5-phosphoribosylamino)uracil reductase RibD [Oceanospirillaceae bacterium]|nr:bifunctional diaminohydroxyphosphoribosylaminopyrimidine deaminase/5-amino-6-(5-phosphoribosylamino)uracil reductase RibD [Oceanospirillaceae bacterium]